MSEAIERRYDDSISTNQSRRHFPSAESFPEPLTEPVEMDLDNFAFDQESLNESIHEMAFTFGADEEFQPKTLKKKEEERKVSLKVVSVTETQTIDRDNGLQVREDPPPTYAVVMKPKSKANGNITETQVNNDDDSRGPVIKTRKYSVVMKPENVMEEAL